MHFLHASISDSSAAAGALLTSSCCATWMCSEATLHGTALGMTKKGTPVYGVYAMTGRQSTCLPDTDEGATGSERPA